MSVEEDKICVDSLENLKALAAATNKELQTLHTKHLMPSFSTNNFEFLLEDIKNGKFDENRLHILKKVQWHILKSSETTKNKCKLSSERPTKTEVKNFSHFPKSFKENTLEQKSEVANRESKLNSFTSKLNYIDKFLDKKISEHEKRNKNLQFHQQNKFLSKYNGGHNIKNVNIQESKHLNSSKRLRKTSDSQRIKGVKDESSSVYSITQPKLEKYIIPNINILPVNKEIQSVNISMDKKFNKKKLTENMKDPTLTEHISKYNPLVQIINNDSINIIPLGEQRQPSITIPVGVKKKPASSNQGLFVFKHSQVDLSDDNDSEGESPFHHSYSPEGHSYQGITYKDDASSVANEENINFHFDQNESETEIHIQGNEFNPKKFIDRLEERLGMILTSLPAKSFQNIMDLDDGKDTDVGTSSHVNPSFTVTSNVNVYVQTESQEEVPSPELESLHSGVPVSDEHIAKETSSSYRDYSEEFFEDSEDHSLSPRENVTKENEKADENESDNDEERDHLQNTEKTLPEEVEEKVKEEEPEKKVEIIEDYSSSSLVSSPSNELKRHSILSGEKVLPLPVSPEKSKDNSQEHSNGKEDFYKPVHEIFSPSRRSRDSSSHVRQLSGSASAINEEEAEATDKDLTPVPSQVEEKPPDTHSSAEGPNTPLDVKTQSHSSQHFDPDAEEEKLSPQTEKVVPSPSQAESASKSEKSVQSENTSSYDLVNETVSMSAGETILPSIEVGEVTISDGEIEFEASISDIQPGDHIKFKFSTGDLLQESSNSIPHSVGALDHLGARPHLTTKETQTPKWSVNVAADTSEDTASQPPKEANGNEIILDSSFSEGLALDVGESEAPTYNTATETSDDITTYNNYSEGEILEDGSPRSLSVNPLEMRSLGRENEILRRRLASFTGRFCLSNSSGD